MRENLRFLPSVSPSAVGSDVNPFYYVYDYQGTSVTEARAHPNFLTRGVLYNWPAAMTACPPGTRLPTDEELHVLERTFATGTCDPGRIWPNDWACNPAGTALKASSVTTPVAWDGNNFSGFTAIPAGLRRSDGSFGLFAVHAGFWSSSEFGTSSWRRALDSGLSTVARWATGRMYGFSVRCVR